MSDEKKNDGGPAFPITRSTEIYTSRLYRRAISLLQKKYKTFGELLDSINMSDERLLALTRELNEKNGAYTEWSRMRNRLEAIPGFGWSLASNVISVVEEMVSMELLQKEVADSKKASTALRDHFAGVAMQGYWASQTEESCSLDWMQANPELESGQLRIVAELAYAQADAMIKARDK